MRGVDRSPALNRGRRRLALGLAASLSLSLVACAGDDDARVPTPTAAASPTPAAADEATPAASTPAPDPLPAASTEPVERAAENTDPALLTAVRAAQQDGFERVVFEFKNAVPGYRVGYVDRPVTQDGSGSEVAVNGDAVLQVRMQGASGVDLSQPEAPATYAGPARLTPGTSNVAELVRTGDFEGTLTWAIGLRQRSAFTVTTLDGPPRLVIDVRTP